MKLQFRRFAISDLESIKSWGTDKWGADRTDAFLLEMRRSMERLVNFPGLGRAHPVLNPKLKSLRFRSYIIFYTVEPEGPTVARIIHDRRDQSMIDFASGLDAAVNPAP